MQKSKYSENSTFAKIVELVKNQGYYIRKVVYNEGTIIHEIVKNTEPGTSTIHCEVAANIAKAIEMETGTVTQYDGKITNPVNFFPVPVKRDCVRHLFTS